MLGLVNAILVSACSLERIVMIGECARMLVHCGNATRLDLASPLPFDEQWSIRLCRVCAAAPRGMHANAALVHLAFVSLVEALGSGVAPINLLYERESGGDNATRAAGIGPAHFEAQDAATLAEAFRVAAPIG